MSITKAPKKADGFILVQPRLNFEIPGPILTPQRLGVLLISDSLTKPDGRNLFVGQDKA